MTEPLFSHEGPEGIEPIIADGQLREFVGGLSDQLSQQQIAWPMEATSAVAVLGRHSDIGISTLFSVYEHLRDRKKIKMEQVLHGSRRRNAFDFSQTLAFASVSHVAHADLNFYVQQSFKSLVEETKDRLGNHPLSDLLITDEEKRALASPQAGLVGRTFHDPKVDNAESERAKKQVKDYMIVLEKNKHLILPPDTQEALRRISNAYTALKGKDEMSYSLGEALKTSNRLLEINPEVSDLFELADRLEDDLADSDSRQSK